MKRLFVFWFLGFCHAHGQSPGVQHPATDDLGRKLPSHGTAGAPRSNKTVALFYWTWHVQHSQFNKAFNISRILDGRPEMVKDYHHPSWAPYSPPAQPNQYTYFWEEPLFGYYDGRDKWVIRKQLEMLGEAGVDVLFYDATNGSFTWKDGYEAVGAVMAEARADGVAVPQFGFMLNFSASESSAVALGQLYDELYGIGKFQESWFRWGGKPVIMAYPESLNNIRLSDTASLRFTANAPFTGISVNCPSWSNNIGDLTLSLHTWNGSLQTSVAATPIASKTFVNFADNAYLKLDFDELPAGDYLWRLSKGRETVGVWKFNEDTAATQSWLNESEVTGDYDCRIHYTAQPSHTELTTGTTRSAVSICEGIMTSAKVDAIRNFFTFRPPQPAYQGGPTRPDQWGWLENYPQNGYVQKSPGKFELVTVGVAQNWSEQTNGLSAMSGTKIRGRSYTKADGFSRLSPDSYLHGYNFQEQWERALQIDPDIIFITGWNEWVMGRYESLWGVPNAFPDAFDLEHSRDIEPTKGGYGDNYYYQMVANIRRFKGMAAPEIASAPTTVKIDGDFADWTAVKPQFTASKGNVQTRNGKGYLDPVTGQPIQYQNNTARNDIIGTKVARNDSHVFFLVETAAPLSPHTDPNWMQLLIDIDRDKGTGWEGYEFRVDRYGASDEATLSSSNGAWAWTDLGAVAYKVAGHRMEIAIPRALLGLQPGEKMDLEFKWIDSPVTPGDIMDLYLNGEAAPSGRFNFHYLVTFAFADWISDLAFGIDPATRGFTDDPDGDDIANGLEAWFGTHPGQSSKCLIATEASENTLIFTHPRNPNTASDLSGRYLWSKDLVTFHEAGAITDGITVTFNAMPDSPSPGITTVTATVSGSATDRIFVKAAVEQVSL